MTADEYEHVRAAGQWHKVERSETGPAGTGYETTCGLRVAPDAVQDHSPIGEYPDDLSGNTVCYRCVNLSEVDR